MKKIFSLFAIASLALVLVACGGNDGYVPNLEDEVALNMSIYTVSSGRKYTVSYRGNDPYVSTVNGRTYSKGDLTPVWESIGEKANIKFTDVANEGDANTNAQWTRLLSAGFDSVDLVNTTPANLAQEGQKGSFINFGDYLDKMPNLSKFLDDNPASALSLTAGNGGIYFTPYFDGINELEHMFLARIDWIEGILDQTDVNKFVSTNSYKVGTSYQPVTPVGAESYKVSVTNMSGVVREVSKSRTQNIMVTLRNLSASGATGKALAEAFRTYIANTYTSLAASGYTKWSQVFAGSDASYDTDELMALMHVIIANQDYLLANVEGVANIVGYFPREQAGNRVRQLMRGLEMFGLRGVNSRNEWLYIDEKNEVQDTRGQQQFADTVNNGLTGLVNDGLILNIGAFAVNDIRGSLLKGSNGAMGFLTYDYNASSTPESLVGETSGGRAKDPNFKFQAILPPVVKWNDGDDKTGYFHFSEAVRSVKGDAWGAPSHVAADQTKLERVLYLVDQMFNYTSADSIGNVHLFGPEGWTEGYIQYNGADVPKFSAKARAEMDAKGMAMIDYLRFYVGATMPIGHVRSLGMEYQTLTEDGLEGIRRINVSTGGINGGGTFKLAGLVNTKNTWYNLIPTTLPLNAIQNAAIAATTFRTHTSDDNLSALVTHGFKGQQGILTVDEYMALVNQSNQFPLFIQQYREAYQLALQLQG